MINYIILLDVSKSTIKDDESFIEIQHVQSFFSLEIKDILDSMVKILL